MMNDTERARVAKMRDALVIVAKGLRNKHIPDRTLIVSRRAKNGQKTMKFVSLKTYIARALKP